jgi:polygalacturonase
LTFTPGHLIEFLGSTKLELSNVQLQNPPFWTFHVYTSSKVWLRDYSVRAPPSTRAGTLTANA